MELCGLILLRLASLVSLPAFVVRAEETFEPASCNLRQQQKCEAEYLECRLYGGPADSAETECSCLTEHYGICLRNAGCAADRMSDCVSELMRFNCEDMTVCGNNCVGNGRGSIDKDTARILPVNNFGKNYLQFSVCDKGVNPAALSRFNEIRMSRCDETSFKICPYWIPPSTFTALAIDHNATYIKMERCVYVPSTSEDASSTGNSSTYSDTDDAAEEDDDYVAECLTNPRPVEYYGTKRLWPSAVDVEYAGDVFCGDDKHCSGSYCDFNHIPPKCAPKATKHFKHEAGRYYSPSFSDDL